MTNTEKKELQKALADCDATLATTIQRRNEAAEAIGHTPIRLHDTNVLLRRPDSASPLEQALTEISNDNKFEMNPHIRYQRERERIAALTAKCAVDIEGLDEKNLSPQQQAALHKLKEQESMSVKHTAQASFTSPNGMDIEVRF